MSNLKPRLAVFTISPHNTTLKTQHKLALLTSVEELDVIQQINNIRRLLIYADSTKFYYQLHLTRWLNLQGADIFRKCFQADFR